MRPPAERAYAILGLDSGATLDDVKQAFRDLAKVWHPDRFAQDERLRAKAEDTFKQINAAYQQLVPVAARPAEEPATPPPARAAAPPPPPRPPSPRPAPAPAVRRRARHARMPLPGAEITIGGRHGYLIDLSLTGARLHVDFAPVLHSTARLAIHVQGEVLALDARVVRAGRREPTHSTADSGSSWTMSVTFVNIGPEAQRTIPRFYNLLLAAAAATAAP